MSSSCDDLCVRPVRTQRSAPTYAERCPCADGSGSQKILYICPSIWSKSGAKMLVADPKIVPLYLCELKFLRFVTSDRFSTPQPGPEPQAKLHTFVGPCIRK